VVVRLSLSEILQIVIRPLPSLHPAPSLYFYSNYSRKKGFVVPTKEFVKIGIAKIFCYNNKLFSSINKTFGCCSEIFGCSNKKIIVVSNFVAVPKPVFFRVSFLQMLLCSNIFLQSMLNLLLKTLSLPAMPFENREKIFYRGSFQFSIFTIKKYHPRKRDI